MKKEKTVEKTGLRINMYVIFDDQVIDSEEIAELIEKESDFLVEKDMSKATKREDVLAYLLTLDFDILKKELEEEYDTTDIDMEEAFGDLMELSDEIAMELEDIMPMYSIMVARTYKIDTTENKVKVLIAVSHTDLGMLKISDVMKRLLSETD